MANKSRYFNDPIPQLYIPTSAASADNQQGMFGNVIDSAQAGALSAVGGIFDFVGADGIAKQFYGWSDKQYEQMSDAGREAMGRQFFEEDQDGNLKIGEGLTSLDTWLLTMANVAGQFAGTAIPGAGAAGAVARAASLGSKGRKVADMVGMGATGGAAATGQGMEQAREEVRNMPDELLADSAIFRDLYLGIDASKPDWNEEQKWDAAKEALAAQVAREVQTDPVALAANFGASAIGDPIIGRALTGARLAKNGAFRSAVRGALIEGSTEAVQAGTQQYSINQALQPIDGRDDMDGVRLAAINEGLPGAGFGGVAGGFGGVANRQPKDQPPPPSNTGSPIAPGNAPVVNPDPSMQLPPEMEAELNRGMDPAVSAVAEQNPTLGAELNALDQASANRQRDVEQALNRQRDLDMPTAARNAGFANSPQDVGRFGDMLTSPVQRSIAELDEMRARTVADMVAMATQDKSPTPQDRFSPIPYEYEVIPAEKPKPAGLLSGILYEGEYLQGYQAEQPPAKIEQKDIIFAGDNRPAQQAQERSQELERMANRFADNARNQPARIPQKDVVFAGNETGVTVKQNGQPFQSQKEALASKSAREAKKAGNQIEAVPFADGFGWQVVAPVEAEQTGTPINESAKISQATDTNVGTTISDQAAVTPSPETDTAPQAAQEAQAMPAIRGTKARTYTPASNKPIDVEYRVVEADSLVTSNDFSGSVNPNYPAEMQPRNRSRQAYQLQVNSIAKNPIADKLLDSPDTDRGAPVVRNGIVESGNGRSIGLREAYRTGRGDAYKQALIARAEQLGLDPEQVASMQQPVLVRERLTELSPAELREFTIDSNQSAGVEQSPAELAKTDAAMIDDALITQLAIPEDGDVLAPMNSRFLRGFAAKLGNNELGSYMTSDGQWNKAFKDRVQNAIFAKGYDDAELLSRISESTNPESKNLLSALMSVAGKLGAIRALDADIGGSLSDAYTQAAGLLARAKREGTTVTAIDAQADMLTGHTDADIVALAESLESMIRSSKKMTALLDGIASSVLTDTRNMGQTDIFTGEPGARPNVNEVIRNAARQQQQPDNAGTPGLFDSPQNQEADSTEQPSIPQATEPSRAESQPSEVSQQAEPTNQTPEQSGVSVSEDAESEVKTAENNATEPAAPIEDFGEKLGGARKDEFRMASQRIDDMTDQQIAQSTLSELFPKNELDKIDDPVSAAFYHVVRDEIPSKPRVDWKLKRWIDEVKAAREMLTLIDNENLSEKFLKELSVKGSASLRKIARRVELLSKLDRKDWSRIGAVDSASGRYRNEAGEMVPGSWYAVRIDGRSKHYYDKQSVDQIIDDVKQDLAKSEQTETRMKFEIRGRDGSYFINKTGDKDYTALKRFTDLKAARAFLNENYNDLVQLWDAVKQRENVAKADLRSNKNGARTGVDHRNGADVTPEQFAEAFGLRGVEFGNWVKQGKENRERQSLLNDAFDAFMDLASVLNIPPRAIGFGGKLGIGFGSRGRGGKAAAHYETGKFIINLTKTQGAGSLAHEWLHALDNYFSSYRGGQKITENRDGKLKQVDSDFSYITFQPEQMLYNPKTGTKLTKAQLADFHKRHPTAGIYKPENFIPDPTHPDGVRPEVEAAFAKFVNALDDSPMKKRSLNTDGGKPGYWSRIIERAARGFETYIISRLADQGYRNDFLANVTSFERFTRNPDKYPYLKPDEQGQINEALDNLFAVMETKETDKGTMLFSKTVNVAGNELGPYSTLEELWGKARQYGKENFNNLDVEIKDDNTNTTVAWQGIKHTFSQRINKQTAQVVVKLPELIENATLIDTREDKSDRNTIKQVRIYESFADINGESHRFEIVVRDHTDGKSRYYNHKLKPPAGISGEPESNQGSGQPSAEGSGEIVADRNKESKNPDIKFAAANTTGTKPTRPISVKAAERAADSFVKTLSGAAGIKVVVLPSQKEAARLWRMSLDGAFIRGAYDDKTGTAYVIADNLESTQELREVIAHEIFAHGGLDKVIGADKKQQFLDRILQTRNNKAFADLWAQIDEDYAKDSDAVKAEELFAYFVQNQPQRGPVKFWWNAFKRWLNNILANLGITSKGDPDVDLMQSMMESIMFGFQFGRQADSNADGNMAFSKDDDATNTPAFKRWFGDSKVVDENGEPLVVYHGTVKEFSEFDRKFNAEYAPDFYFTDTPEVADYATGTVETEWFPDGANVMPVYLKMKNPLVVDMEQGHVPNKIVSLRNQALKGGHDGIIARNAAMPFATGTEYIVFDAKQIKSAVGNNGDFDPTNPDIRFSKTKGQPDNRTAKEKLGLADQADETLKEMVTARYKETADTLKSSQFWKRLGEGIFDGMSGILNAEVSSGITDPNKQGYVSARLASGLADVLHGVFHFGAPEWKGGIVARKADTKGLLEVFSMLGDDLNSWLAWMGANRAEQLMAEGRENNLTAKDIAELKALAAGKEAKFEEVRKEYNKINSAIIDLAQQAGLISDAQRSGFDEEWYVPFFRNMENEVDPEMQGIAAMVHGPKSKNGIANQSAQLKELKGGKQSTKDLLENIIQRHSTLIDAALKNNAMLEIVGNLSGTDYMQPVTSPDIKALSQTELNLLSKVKVMRDGKAEAYAVSDPALLRGLLQLNSGGNNSLFNRMARSAKRFLTAGITLSPDFIVKNFVRDAAHAWMVNKDDFKFGSDSIKGLRKAFKEDEAYRDLIFSGAAFQGGYIHGADPEAAAQQIRRALKSKGLTINEVNSYMDTVVTKGGQLLERYRNASDKVENANRLMTYEAALKAGKSARQAAFEAKDLMDYSLKGNFTLIGTMIDMLPFFNARLQGMSKLVRAAKAGDGDRVLKVLSANLAMKGIKVAGFSLALAALHSDDERYKELADWDKDSSWHFWLGDDHIRIPKPFELGIIFGTIPERMLHYGAGHQPASDLAKAVGHAVFNTLALNPIPQFALPIAETAVNKSFFRGTDIENMSDENKLKEDRYNAYTSETAKLIGKLSGHFGVSPKQVEHLVLGYTGTIGGYVLSISDVIARTMLGIEAADAPISRYPVIKAFYQGSGPKTNTKFQQEFYDALKAANQAYGSYKRAAEEGNTERQQMLLEKNKDKLSSRIQLNRLQRQISELNKQADRVNINQSLSGEQKRERLDEIARRKNALYQAAYVRFNLGEW